MAFLIPDNTISMNGVLVNYYPINQHNTRKISMPTTKMTSIIGVTIHNTDMINVQSGTTAAEQYTRATVAGNMNTVRVHYYVDSKVAWQNLPLTLTSWHAADGNGNGNMHTISIECIMSKRYDDNDKQAEDNAARLAAALLKTYGLTVDNLYTHTHWLNVRDGKKGSVDYLNTARHPYKMCPLYILPHWQEFKAKVASYMGVEVKSSTPETVKPTTDSSYLVRVTCKELNVRMDAGVEYPITTKVHSGEVYTIVETKKAADGGSWGRLKSGVGWINVSPSFCCKLT